MINVSKLPAAIKQSVRESFGVRYDDPSKDSEIAELYPSEVLERYFRTQRLDMKENSSRVYHAAVDIFLATESNGGTKCKKN